MTLISFSISKCLELLNEVSLSLGRSNIENTLQSQRKIDDEIARFKIWSNCTAAYQNGQNSLDHHLRDSSHLRKQVIELLKDLNDLLQDAMSIIRGETVPWDETMKEDKSDMDFDENHNEDSLDNLSVETHTTVTEMDQILTDVSEVITCLLRLSISIINPAPHDWYIKSNFTDMTHFEPYDIQHVRAKFPLANKNNIIVERLGMAITWRRGNFQYRKNIKLAQKTDTEDTDRAEIIDESTVPSIFSEPQKNNKAKQLAINAFDQENQSDGEVSQTSYAFSEADTERLKCPPLPKEAMYGSFECPYCFLPVLIESKMMWRQHIFRDLRPYVCLWEGCPTPNRRFCKRRQWMAHMIQQHWRIWHCVLGCEGFFLSADEFERHIELHHNSIVGPQLSTLVSLSERPRSLDDAAQCQLCLEDILSFRRYPEHVGNHQEELALFALPKETCNTDIEEDIPENASSGIFKTVSELGMDSDEELAPFAPLKETFNFNTEGTLVDKKFGILETLGKLKEKLLSSFGVSNEIKNINSEGDTEDKDHSASLHIYETPSELDTGEHPENKVSEHELSLEVQHFNEQVDVKQNEDYMKPRFITLNHPLSSQFKTKLEIRSKNVTSQDIRDRLPQYASTLLSQAHEGEDTREFFLADVPKDAASVGSNSWIWNPIFRNYYRDKYVNGQRKTIWAKPARNLVRYDTAPDPKTYAAQQSAQQNTSQFRGGISSDTKELDFEELNRSYRVRMSADKFFIKGKVFAVLFHESCGHTVENLETDSNISRVKYGEYIYSQIRRFVVVQERHGFCNSCPIYTYGQRGTTKPGVDAEVHGIIHTKNTKPELVPGEATGVQRRAIRLIPVDSSIALSSASRIHYGKPHPIEHNVKVKDLGNIHPEDIMKMLDYWRKAQDD